MSVTAFISANSADFARVRTPDTEPQQREKLSAALTESGGHVLPEQDGALRVTGLPLSRISDIAHDHDVRLWELSPHQASLEEAYMRMTQAAVDYRSTIDQKEGLQQQLPPGVQPPMPVPGQGQPGWYAPPPPQPGGQPFTMPPQGTPGQAPAGPYGAPGAPGTAPITPGASGAGTSNPYAQPSGQAPQPPAVPAAPAPQASAASARPADQAPQAAPATPAGPAAQAGVGAQPAARPAPQAPAAPAPAPTSDLTKPEDPR
jgi:ABC-2 type transport system ATP-binding protein